MDSLGLGGWLGSCRHLRREERGSAGLEQPEAGSQAGLRCLPCLWYGRGREYGQENGECLVLMCMYSTSERALYETIWGHPKPGDAQYTLKGVILHMHMLAFGQKWKQSNKETFLLF